MKRKKVLPIIAGLLVTGVEGTRTFLVDDRTGELSRKGERRLSSRFSR